MSRTKKTPASQSLAARATKGPNRTPKGSGPSVAPSLEARVAGLERAVMALAVHLPAALFDVQDKADAKSKRFLGELESLFNVAGTLARLRLPEEAYDDAFEEWEALPRTTKAREEETRRRLGDRFIELGIATPEELGRGAAEVRS